MNSSSASLISGRIADDVRTPGLHGAPRLHPFRIAAFFAVVLGLGAAVLAILLARTGTVLGGEFAAYVCLGLALLALAAFCQYRGHDWRLKDSATIVAIAIFGLMLCGLISNIGLRLGLPLADPLLARIDRVFLFDTPAAVRFTVSQPAVSALLHLAYNSSGLLCVVAACRLLIAGNRPALWSFVATLICAMQITALVSMFFPARGAILSFGLDALQGHGLPYGAGSYSAEQFAHFYYGVDPLVTLSKMHGIVTFPSFHTVMALMILQGFRHTRLRSLAMVWCALTIVSTVPMGGHYVVDLAGGLAVWLVAYLLAQSACVVHRTSTSALCQTRLGPLRTANRQAGRFLKILLPAA